MVVDMSRAFERGARPGVPERESPRRACSDGMLRAGVEYLATSTCCSGPHTNPWRPNDGRAIEPGDLVYVDTDTVGIEWLFLLRLAHVPGGDEPPTPAQRDTYRAALDWLEAMTALVRPGLTAAS